MARPNNSNQSNDILKYSLIGVAVLATLMLVITFAPTGKYWETKNHEWTQLSATWNPEPSYDWTSEGNTWSFNGEWKANVWVSDNTACEAFDQTLITSKGFNAWKVDGKTPLMCCKKWDSDTGVFEFVHTSATSSIQGGVNVGPTESICTGTGVITNTPISFPNDPLVVKSGTCLDSNGNELEVETNYQFYNEDNCKEQIGICSDKDGTELLSTDGTALYSTKSDCESAGTCSDETSETEAECIQRSWEKNRWIANKFESGTCKQFDPTTVSHKSLNLPSNIDKTYSCINELVGSYWGGICINAALDNNVWLVDVEGLNSPWNRKDNCLQTSSCTNSEFTDKESCAEAAGTCSDSEGIEFKDELGNSLYLTRNTCESAGTCSDETSDTEAECISKTYEFEIVEEDDSVEPIIESGETILGLTASFTYDPEAPTVDEEITFDASSSNSALMAEACLNDRAHNPILDQFPDEEICVKYGTCSDGSVAKDKKWGEFTGTRENGCIGELEGSFIQNTWGKPTIIEYSWEFDDSSQIGASATQIYNTEGDFDVTLTVKSYNGIISSFKQTITIGQQVTVPPTLIPASFDALTYQSNSCNTNIDAGDETGSAILIIEILDNAKVSHYQYVEIAELADWSSKKFPATLSGVGDLTGTSCKVMLWRSWTGEPIVDAIESTYTAE